MIKTEEDDEFDRIKMEQEIRLKHNEKEPAMSYTISGISKPVGSWVLYAEATPCNQFSMYHKPTRIQIWFTEKLLGWKWKDI
jgi:hypothetical protein